MQSAADREIRLGIWKIHILHHAASREVWGKWLLDELAEHGHSLSPGTLYPALSRMERNRWLERTCEATHARARQTFRVTRAGFELLEALRRDVSELYEEVVLEAGPGHEARVPQLNEKPRAINETHRGRKQSGGDNDEIIKTDTRGTKKLSGQRKLDVRAHSGRLRSGGNRGKQPKRRA
jgi:PadR family transcriptional regulator PadR